MKKLVLFLMVVLTGCASVASPSLLDNNYYMMGDSSCVRARFISDTRIMCIQNDGTETGYRDAMTPQELQMYQVRMIQQQQSMQELTQSMQQLGQTFQNAGNQIRQQSQSWTPPQVQPISPHGSGITTYRQFGNTWMGSNGSSCQVVGQSILCSDGKRCQMIGQNLVCN